MASIEHGQHRGASRVLTAAAKLMGVLTLREMFSSYVSFVRFSMNALGDHMSCLNPRKDGAILSFWPKRLRLRSVAKLRGYRSARPR